MISSVFIGNDLETALRHCQRTGLHHIEIGAGGGYPRRHCDPHALLNDPTQLRRFRELLAKYEVRISAFAIHGEPLHPNPEIARKYSVEFEEACELAAALGVSKLTLLAGLPGATPDDPNPNWIVYPYPARNRDWLEWQWAERCIPYWRQHAKVAEDHGVRLCFELHPVDLVYHPAALLRLRTEIGSVIGANVDPSHLIWQGMDPCIVLMELGPAVYHVHAKDTRLNNALVARQGILDPSPWTDVANRSWSFRTVGYGSSELFWRDFISALRVIGYDDVLSIEHEDPLLDRLEGFEKAVAFLRPLLASRPGSPIWMDVRDSGAQS